MRETCTDGALGHGLASLLVVCQPILYTIDLTTVNNDFLYVILDCSLIPIYGSSPNSTPEATMVHMKI
jgi:hypothetical protein